MTSPNPDTTPSDPQSESSSPEGRTIGRKLGEWLKALVFGGLVLVMDMRHVTDPRAQSEDPVVAERMCAKHRLAWELVARAMRWARALQARLAAEARAARTGKSQETERLERVARLLARPDWYVPTKGRKRAPDTSIRPRADDCIAGLPVPEVMAHVCTDLINASTLLAKSQVLGVLVKIARDVRAMLGGPTEVWEAPPVWPAPQSVAGAAIRQAPVMGFRAPDTG
jgi:hypothetical protein